MSHLPKHVKIVEVGPRDGLQNESADCLSTAFKLELIERLSQIGLSTIEVASFVSKRWVPQMADSLQVLEKITRNPHVKYTALTPNVTGVETAVKGRADEVAIFGAASETFTQKNINCSIAESLTRFAKVIEAAKHHNLPVRGYVSTVMGCPYEGDIPVESVVSLCNQLYQMGCYEISLGDTIGIGTPLRVKKLLNALTAILPRECLALHFHNTYGQALPNIYAGLEEGISIVDSSIAGLGGCPYARGASGNVATEDVVYMLEGMEIETGVDLNKLVNTSRWVSKALGIPNQSHVAEAWFSHN